MFAYVYTHEHTTQCADISCRVHILDLPRFPVFICNYHNFPSLLTDVLFYKAFFANFNNCNIKIETSVTILVLYLYQTYNVAQLFYCKNVYSISIDEEPKTIAGINCIFFLFFIRNFNVVTHMIIK